MLMKAVSDCSTTAIETISQSTVLTNQYNPKVIMLPLYVLGYSLIDYLRRYNCKEFNYKKERQKAEEKIAKMRKSVNKEWLSLLLLSSLTTVKDVYSC